MGKAYVLKRSSDTKYYFNLRTENNEIILTSEKYISKQNATKGINSVKSNSLIESRYERNVSSRGNYYFNLIDENNEIIGTSEEYYLMEERENGINDVKIIAPIASVIDMTQM